MLAWGKNHDPMFAPFHLALKLRFPYLVPRNAGSGGALDVMDAKGCSVEIYRDSIEALAKHSRWKDTVLTCEQALEIHLAHEFFHILEYLENSSVVKEMEPVQTFSFFGLRRFSQVQRCGEIAAHVFAKELLKLPVLPNLYDYLYLIGTGKMTPLAFDDMVDIQKGNIAFSEKNVMMN